MKIVVEALLSDIEVQIELLDGLAIIHLEILHTEMIKVKGIAQVASLADSLFHHIALLIIKFHDSSTPSIDRDEGCLAYPTMTVVSYLKAIEDEGGQALSLHLYSTARTLIVGTVGEIGILVEADAIKFDKFRLTNKALCTINS